MDQWPLVIDEVEVGARLIREFHRYAAVELAFWLKANDDDYRYLYLTSDQINPTNRGQAYAELLRLMEGLPTSFQNPFRVALIWPTDRLARAALQIRQRHPDRVGTRLHSQTFGDRFVADLYVYPDSVLDDLASHAEVVPKVSAS